MIVKAIRQGLGHVIVLGDKLTRPAKLQRSADAQTKVDAQTKNMALYQFYACPFCVKTRRAMRRLNLSIETRNANVAGEHRDNLEMIGGRIKVPCLRIVENGQDQWMYESNDIIAYLEDRFGAIT